MVPPETHTVQGTDPPAIAVENLSKVYDHAWSKTVTALDGVSLGIDHGSVVGVLGPNGAGKTTLIKCILDIVVPTSGEVRIEGIPVDQHGTDMYRTVSAMLEGARNVYWRLTVRENLEYFTSLQERDPATVRETNDRLIESVGLAEKAGEPVNNLSRGMKQKTALICALARRTPIVFLDEPTLGLDVETTNNLLAELEGLIDDEDRTIVLTSHDMDVVEHLCDRVVILESGGIVADEPIDELLELFRTQAYEILLDGAVDSTLRRTLERTFGEVAWDRHGGDTELTVVLSGPDQFYDLIHHLEAADATIQAISTVEADLEEAFLRVVEDGERSRAHPAGRR